MGRGEGGGGVKRKYCVPENTMGIANSYLLLYIFAFFIGGGGGEGITLCQKIQLEYR